MRAAMHAAHQAAHESQAADIASVAQEFAGLDNVIDCAAAGGRAVQQELVVRQLEMAWAAEQLKKAQDANRQLVGAAAGGTCF